MIIGSEPCSKPISNPHCPATAKSPILLHLKTFFFMNINYTSRISYTLLCLVFCLLLQLIGLLRRARFVVSVDSGPMHLASALRRPLLGLHTWSDPRKVGPYDPGAWVWKAGRILRRHEVDDALAGHAGGLDPAALRLLADFVAGKVRAGSD